MTAGCSRSRPASPTAGSSIALRATASMRASSRSRPPTGTLQAASLDGRAGDRRRRRDAETSIVVGDTSFDMAMAVNAGATRDRRRLGLSRRRGVARGGRRRRRRRGRSTFWNSFGSMPMDDDVSRASGCCSIRWCASSAWRSSSSGSRSSTPACSAPADGRNSARSLRFSACSTPSFAPRLLKKALGPAGPRARMKRFWKEVAVEREDDGWAIELDGRPVRTPARAPLLRPDRGAGGGDCRGMALGRRDDRSARDAADRPRQCGDRPDCARPAGIRGRPGALRRGRPRLLSRRAARGACRPAGEELGRAARLGAAPLRRRFRDDLRIAARAAAARDGRTPWPRGRGARRRSNSPACRRW